MKRQALSKKTRFEVFKRDNFTCQYCGAKPDESLLVVDHMHPVKLGGTNDMINLITSCQPCNQGKAARLLNEIHPRPDADLMRLEVHQEIAELERFQTVEQAKVAAIDETIRLIREHFTGLTGLRWQPQDQQIRLMLARYEPSIVKEAIGALAKKMNHLKSQGEDATQMNWSAYTWAVCKKISEKITTQVFPVGFCGEFFFLMELKVDEGSSGLTTDDIKFMSGVYQPPLMKAWLKSQHPNSFAFPTELASSFLRAGHHFEPFAIEFIQELQSGRIDSPGMQDAWTDYVYAKSVESDSGNKWLEDQARNAA
jgi:hypothetical protein